VGVSIDPVALRIDADTAAPQTPCEHFARHAAGKFACCGIAKHVGSHVQGNAGLQRRRAEGQGPTCVVGDRRAAFPSDHALLEALDQEVAHARDRRAEFPMPPQLINAGQTAQPNAGVKAVVDTGAAKTPGG